MLMGSNRLSMTSRCPACLSESVHRSDDLHHYLRLRTYKSIYLCRKCKHAFRTPPLSADPLLSDRVELASGEVIYGRFTSLEIGSCPNASRRYEIVKRFRKVLDFGCGDGSFVYASYQKGLNIYGYDINTPEKSSHIPGRFLDSLANQNVGSFDCVTSSHVLEHIHDLDLAIVSMIACIKPGASLVIDVPNELFSLKSRVKRFLRIRSRSATSLYEHCHFFSPLSLRLLMQRHGLTVRSSQTTEIFSKLSTLPIRSIAALLNSGSQISLIATL